MIPSNVDLFHAEIHIDDSYAKRITEYKGEFDIIIPDGRDRVNCAKNALHSLKEGGVIVWDGSDRTSYKEGFEHLFEKGFKKID